MDRQQVYPGAIPLETDLLNTNRNVMTAIAKVCAAVFGTGTIVNGLTVTQTTVASMQVSISAGEIYELANLDGSAYSSLAADTTHQIMKQGISLDAQLLTLAAPGTTGFSINYLIQATFSETDTTPVVLPYYNASNPSIAYSGPANAGTTNNTKRQGLVTLSAKAGTAATTGTQTTPSPDSGYVGLTVVTVAYGASSITNSNISTYYAAPYLPAGGIVGGLQQSGVAGGTSDAITANFTPAPTALVNGLTLIVRAGAANATTTPTFAPNGLTAKTIVKGNNLALSAADIAGAGHWLELQYDTTLGVWVLQNPATGIGALNKLTVVQSNQTPLPGTSTGISFTHGLGSTPVDAQLELVCLTAELGYSVGDVVSNVFNQPSGTSYAIHSVRRNSTVVSAVTGSTVAFCISHASTGTPSTPTPANWAWRFKLRAY